MEMTDDELIEYLRTPKTFAILGASTNPKKAGNFVPDFLMKRGWKMVLINPMADEILGLPTIDSLDDLDQEVDGIIIYRKPEIVAEFAKKAIDKGIPLVWLPLGVVSEEAKAYAEEKGVKFVQDKCPKELIEHYIKDVIYES